MGDHADKGYLAAVEDGWTYEAWPTRILQAIGVVLFLAFWLKLDTIVPILLGH